MIRPSFLLAGIGILILVVLSVVGGWKLGSSHWQKKYSDVQQILAQVTATGQAANTAARAKEQALQDQFSQEASAHAESENRLRERADVAERNYAHKLFDITSHCPGRVPEATADSRTASGATALAERLEGIATHLRRVGSNAEWDANQYAEAQRILRAERDILR